MKARLWPGMPALAAVATVPTGSPPRLGEVDTMPLRRHAARTAAVSLMILVGMPGEGSAGGHRRHAGRGHGPSVGYAVPLQSVFQYPAPLVSQPTLRTGYAVPLQSVFQFPAPLISQPGAAPFALRDTGYGPDLGGHFVPR